MGFSRRVLPPDLPHVFHRVLLLVVGLLVLPFVTPEAQSQPFDYPDTRSVDTVDVYHGTRVPDPFRWLEDLDSDSTQAWIEAQNDLTFDYLSSIPERPAIRKRLTELWNYPRYGTPTRHGDYEFYNRNDGLQDQSVIYVRPALSPDTPAQSTRDSSARVLLDPNSWSDDGTVSLSAFSPSPNGRYVAYGKSRSGSDWKTLHVRRVSTGETLRDTIEWVKFSRPIWRHDGEGFYYGRYPKPEDGATYEAQTKGQTLYYHELGTPQSADRLVYERPDNPKLGFSARVTHDGQHLVVVSSEGTAEKTEMYVKPLPAAAGDSDAGADTGSAAPQEAFTTLIEGFDAQYQFIGAEDSTFYVSTNLDAPTGRVVAISLDRPEREHWTTVIPERDDAVLKGVHLAGGKLVVQSLVDVQARLEVYTLDGTLDATIDLPALGSLYGVDGWPDDPVMYYGFSSFTYPYTVFRYNLSTGTSEVVFQPEVDVDADRYRVRQVFYESLDGTEIPMFIVHKKGMALDGTNPTYLYGYGGFNVTLTPSYSPRRIAWLEMGGVYAVPNLRGGGAYGEAWHEAGMLDRKQTVFDDFAAAAQYLIDAGYTTPDKLAIGGGSNGGLLTGASITQRPHLFGAAIVRVGVLDMLRYHKFTIGWAWVPEYGSSEDPEQFEYLYDYSPLHNVVPGVSYPSTLITTADTDDRVVPAHSYKFAAAMQKAQGGDAPILLRVETDAGHGSGTPTSKEIEQAADVWAFLVQELGVRVPELAPTTHSPSDSETMGGR